MINSTSDKRAAGRARIRRGAKSHKLSRLRLSEAAAEFGDHVACTQDDAQQGKSNEGEQNGQENLEEVEEDRSNQALDGSCFLGGGKEVSPDFHGQERAEGHDAA